MKSASTDGADGLERRYLLVSAGGNLSIGLAGLAVSFASASQVILLDGLFNLTYFATGLFALRVARLVRRGDDERFPAGYGFFEPLTNGMKGTLVLGITAMALFDAVVALTSGGRAIAAGTAVIYGLFAAAACWILAWITRTGARRTESPLVRTDAQNWIVNAAISSCVLVAFGAIFLMRGTRAEPLIPYVDPGAVVLLGLISISIPVRMAWSALMQLLNRAPSEGVTRTVRASLESALAELPVQELFVRVLQPGRTRMVWAHVVLPAEFVLRDGLPELDSLRARALERLRAEHAGVILDMLFTADRRWGAPESPGLSPEG